MSKKQTHPTELIGECVEVIDSTNKSIIGIRGSVIDETKNTLIIDADGRVVTLIKSHITFRLDNGKTIQGNTITKRSSDRIKG